MRLRPGQIAQAGAADGDILTWDDTAGEWVPSAPTGGGGGAGTGLTNHAQFATYTLSPSPNASYPEDTTSRFTTGGSWTTVGKLVDGMTGGGYTGGQYIGWTGSVTPTVSFDLGSAKSVEQAIIRGRYGTGGVYKPASFKVEHSDDNSTWTTDTNPTGLTDTSQPGDRDWIADLAFTAGSHRYWRLTFTLSSSGGWLFLGDIELLGT